ncbi:MAG: nuclear transport factor 2 family protein [Mycobacterium sp.]
MDSNLLAVFNEPDDERRAEAIARTYTDEVAWSDDDGVTVGRAALAAKAQELVSRFAGLEFSKVGEVRQTSNFGLLAWRLGPPGGEPVATGFDAAVIADGRIAQLFTVVDPPSP